MSAEIPSPTKEIDYVDLEVLESHGINTALWGVGSAKTVEHLAAELEANEATLTSENGRLIRTTRILGVDVCCATKDGMKILREVRQEFRDGRIRYRTLPTSLGEKLTPYENVISGVTRALSEELGLNEIKIIGKLNDEARERDSESYPGVTTRSLIHNYAVLIDYSAYKPWGYVEHQADKSTYFEWV